MPIDKTVTRVRIEFADCTYQELDTIEDCRKWNEMVRAQASMAYVHGMQFPPLPWKTGPVLDVDGFKFVFTGQICDCGHVHTKRYCGHMDPVGGSICICDEPLTESSDELCNVCMVAHHDQCANNPNCPCCRDTIKRKK